MSQKPIREIDGKRMLAKYVYIFFKKEYFLKKNCHEIEKKKLRIIN